MAVQRIVGYAVLFVEKGMPYILENAVYSSKKEAEDAGKRSGLPVFHVNSVDIVVPSLTVLTPRLT